MCLSSGTLWLSPRRPLPVPVHTGVSTKNRTTKRRCWGKKTVGKHFWAVGALLSWRSACPQPVGDVAGCSACPSAGVGELLGAISTQSCVPELLGCCGMWPGSQPQQSRGIPMGQRCPNGRTLGKGQECFALLITCWIYPCKCPPVSFQ